MKPDDAWAREIDTNGRTLADRVADTLSDIRDIALREDAAGEHVHDWQPVAYMNESRWVIALCRSGCTATFAVRPGEVITRDPSVRPVDA